MKILVSQNKEIATKQIANEIINSVISKPSLVLGVATGKTMIPVYKNLVKMSRKERIDWSRVNFFMIDEYIDVQDSRSRFDYYLNSALFKPLKIKDNKINRIQADSKNKNFSREYENRIKKLGYADLLLLGIGKNGHIAFNEPGSSRDSKTRIIKISSSTIKSNFKNIKNSPKKAITIGISTILKSKRIIIAAFGKEKSKIIKKTLYCDICKEIPATFLKLHEKVLVVLDKAAASRIS